LTDGVQSFRARGFANSIFKGRRHIVPDEDGIDFPDVATSTREALWNALGTPGDAVKSGKAKVSELIMTADEQETVEV
jgi:hypothetical protein